jgi:hypothetical protein
MTTLAEKVAEKTRLFDRAEKVAEAKLADLMVYRKLREAAAAPKPVGYGTPRL